MNGQGRGKIFYLNHIFRFKQKHALLAPIYIQIISIWSNACDMWCHDNCRSMNIIQLCYLQGALRNVWTVYLNKGGAETKCKQEVNSTPTVLNLSKQWLYILLCNGTYYRMLSTIDTIYPMHPFNQTQTKLNPVYEGSSYYKLCSLGMDTIYSDIRIHWFPML